MMEETPRAQNDESQERYHLLIDGAAGFAIIELDLDGRVTLWNAGAERILGYTEEEIAGEHFSCFFTGADRDAGLPEAELRRARNNVRGDNDNELVRKDGSRFWAYGATTALRDTAGNLRGYAKIVRDVSERRRNERMREQQAQLLELIASGASLDKCLNALCLAVPRISAGVRASILMADAAGASFQRPIAPELQESWGEGLNGAPINELM